MSDGHRIEIAHDYSETYAACSCGWRGPFRVGTSPAQSLKDGSRHKAEVDDYDWRRAFTSDEKIMVAEIQGGDECSRNEGRRPRRSIGRTTGLRPLAG